MEIMSRVAEARERVAAANANPRPFWEAFCAKHGLGILVNNTQRYNIFKANVARAVKQNANLTAEKDDTMAYGITQFSHLTQAEFIAIHLDSSMGNLKPQPLSSAESSTSGARKLMQGSMSCDRVRVLPDGPETLPSRLDWRDAGIITPVRDQGGCGSCSAFATIATLESTFIRKWYSRGYRSYNTDLSEDDWLECASGNQCRGAWPDSVFDYYGCQGTAFESSQPYNAHDGNTCRVISRYNPGSRTFGYVGRNTASLARAVYRNPTVIAVDARNWFGLAAGVVRRCNEPFTSLTHAVTVGALQSVWLWSISPLSPLFSLSLSHSQFICLRCSHPLSVVPLWLFSCCV
jgi:Papain family cysteine protease